MAPDLVALQGRIDHSALEAAVDALHRGLLPGWQVRDDRIRIEMVTGKEQ